MLYIDWMWTKRSTTALSCGTYVQSSWERVYPQWGQPGLLQRGKHRRREGVGDDEGGAPWGERRHHLQCPLTGSHCPTVWNPHLLQLQREHRIKKMFSWGGQFWHFFSSSKRSICGRFFTKHLWKRHCKSQTVWTVKVSLTFCQNKDRERNFSREWLWLGSKDGYVDLWEFLCGLVEPQKASTLIG